MYTKKNCIEISQLELCRVLLINDSQYPWLILAPEREKITEMYQRSYEEQLQFIRESSYIAEKLSTLYRAEGVEKTVAAKVVCAKNNY